MEVAPLIFLERKETCETAFKDIPVAKTKKVEYSISNQKYIEKKTNHIAVKDTSTNTYYLIHPVCEITDKIWVKDGTEIALNKKMELKNGFLYKAVQTKGRGYNQERNEECDVFSYRMPIKWMPDNSKEVLIVCIEDYDRSHNIVNKQYIVELERIEMS